MLLLMLLAVVSRDNFEGMERARPIAAQAQIANFLTALDSYYADVGAYPTESQGLQALRTDPGVRGWRGPYMPKDIPLDPWGAPYRYRLDAGRPQISPQH
jgi:general secretion pathway protein G